LEETLIRNRLELKTALYNRKLIRDKTGQGLRSGHSRGN
jgi:hypothetical protein